MKKNMELTKGNKIQITWLDAFGRGSWNTHEDVEDGLKNYIKCEIVGYFVKKDKNFIVLSMGIQNDPNSIPFLCIEFIPIGCIVNIKKL